MLYTHNTTHTQNTFCHVFILPMCVVFCVSMHTHNTTHTHNTFCHAFILLMCVVFCVSNAHTEYNTCAKHLALCVHIARMRVVCSYCPYAWCVAYVLSCVLCYVCILLTCLAHIHTHICAINRVDRLLYMVYT